jgi:hypothetical protein
LELLGFRRLGSLSSKRALQVVVAVLAFIPTLAGIFGILRGPALLRLPPPWPTDLDSHFRFLSGVFLGVGLSFYSCIPTIDEKTERFRRLAALIIVGGLARLLSLLVAGVPTLGHCGGLMMELMVVPCLLIWQSHIAVPNSECLSLKYIFGQSL